MLKRYRSYIKICAHPECGEYTENGMVDFCASHQREFRKQETESKKQLEKRKSLIQKAQSRNLEPRNMPKKVGTTNTWSCSSGKRVTQAEINRYRDAAYNEKSKSVNMEICEGCGRPANCWAHIIAQSECKNIGKTELIWHLGNFFRSCYDCNSAIENPKGVRWHGLKNIGYCLQFISEHDKELFEKFSANGGVLEI